MKQEVKDKLDELLSVCITENLPMFATVAEEVNGETIYESRVQTPLRCRVPLTDDKITKYNASLNKHFNLVLKDREGAGDADADAIGAMLCDMEND
jgi:hypothetical protein